MLTLHGLQQAEKLAHDLRRVREAIAALREDSARRNEVRVDDLTRTYGPDRGRAVATVQKRRIIAMFQDEEAEIVTILRELGVEAEESPTPAAEGQE